MSQPHVLKVARLVRDGPPSEVYEFAGGAGRGGAGVVQAPFWLRPDDTVGTVKRKIMLAMGGPPPVFQGMYLFTSVTKRIEPEEAYRELTMNGIWPLTRSRMAQFLVNVPGIPLDTLADQEEYSYDDLLALKLDERDLQVLVPLGQDFVTTERRYPFAANPFSALDLDPDLVQHAAVLASTTNGRLLSDSGTPHDATLYLCLAGDVLRHARAEGLGEHEALSIYYPLLLHDGVASGAEFESKEGELAEQSKSEVGEAFRRAVGGVDMFYGMAATGSELPYVHGKRGLKSIKVLVAPAYSFNLPLDLVFRLSRASSSVPFIKYMPLRGDPLYRLYTDGVSADGRRVPAMRKADLFRLARALARRRSVVAVSRPVRGVEITCEFRRDGAVELTATSETPLSEDAMAAALAQGSRAVVEPVRDYVAQRGYGLGRFSRLDAPDVSILSGSYTVAIRAPGRPLLRGIRGCTSSVFVGAAGGGMRYRFRRVANYDQMSPENGIIADMLRRNEEMSQVQRALEEGFGLEPAAARRHIEEFLASQVRGDRGLLDSRKIKLRVNPGFPTQLGWDPASGHLSVTLDGFDARDYLTTVPMYLDGLLRLALGEAEVPEAARGLYTELCKPAPQAAPAPEREVVGAVEDLAGAFARDLRTVDSQAETDLMDLIGLGSDDGDSGDSEASDSDEDAGEDSGVSSVSDQSGGAGTPEERDPTGQNLSRRGNWVLERMRTRDPALFKVVKGSASSYSRSCPWNVRRMPVALTDAEKERIDREQPGSYTGAVRYGSPGGPRHWYICPRYWSLRKGMSVSADKVDPTKVIPEKTAAGKNVKEVPQGKDVVEFCSEASREGGRCDGAYRPKVPGFLERGTAGTNMCLPCCFDRAKLTAAHKARMKNCAQEMGDGDGADGGGECTEEDPTNYIVEASRSGPTLKSGKFGALSPTLQRFLGVESEPCYRPGYGSELRSGDSCLVRKGVEPSRKQSFVACVASAWVDERGRGHKAPCIRKMRSILRDAVDLDSFVALQHGSLVTVFGDPQAGWPEARLYTESRLHRSATTADPSALEAVKRAAVAYARFREFLDDDTVRVDQTYIWDLVCTPNPAIFPHGVNLAILEVPERDATDNVHVLCPTNHYGQPLYHAARSTLIMVRHPAGDEAYYEPVYMYKPGRRRGSGVITRRLRAHRDLPPGLRRSLERIAAATEGGCGPLPSVTVKSKRAPALPKLVRILLSRHYEVTHQIMNYNSRVVAVGARAPDNTVGTVPCEPSPPMVDLEAAYSWIDEVDPALQSSYASTLAFLRGVARSTRGSVPALPVVRVEEDGVVSGVITQTDQFVAVTPGPPPAADGLEVIESSSPYAADKQAFSDAGPDPERLKFARSLKLESGFFRAYRDAVRVLLGRPENVGDRRKLQEGAVSNDGGYEARLESAQAIIARIASPHVMFVDYGADALAALGDIPGCLAEGACERQASCRESGEKKCSLAIPRVNLVSGLDNQETYPVRLADEIVRYSRVRDFMFKPDRFLAFGDVAYDLGADEMILPAPLLTQDYFETLVAVERNKYAAFPAFDTAQPQFSREYSQAVGEESGESPEGRPPGQPARAAPGTRLEAQRAPGCEGVLPPKSGPVQGKWAKLFPRGCTDLVYAGAPPPCSFQLFIDLCTQEKKTVSFPELKDTLAAEYRRLARTDRVAVVRVWRQQGKSAMADTATKSGTPLEDIVVLESYYATSFDYWLLAGLYSIPLVLYSGTHLKENGKQVLVTQALEGGGGYYFVKVPGRQVGKAANYRLVVRTEAGGGARLPVRELAPALQELVEGAIGRDTVAAYLDSMATGAVTAAAAAAGAESPARRVGRLRLQAGDGRA